MKWYHYFACFFSGVFLIHLVPHLTHGLSLANVAGVVISFGGGLLLLWAGRFSFRNVWAVLLVLVGMASVLLFASVRTHGGHGM